MRAIGARGPEAGRGYVAFTASERRVPGHLNVLVALALKKVPSALARHRARPTHEEQSNQTEPDAADDDDDGA